MDSYLSGRENLGDSPKAKDDASLLPPQALEKLQAPPDNEVQMEEQEGQAGSKVHYVTEEGRVTKILVTCSCGHVTEIDCSYSDDPS